jgi:hypothetical protein
MGCRRSAVSCRSPASGESSRTCSLSHGLTMYRRSRGSKGHPQHERCTVRITPWVASVSLRDRRGGTVGCGSCRTARARDANGSGRRACAQRSPDSLDLLTYGAIVEATALGDGRTLRTNNCAFLCRLQCAHTPIMEVGRVRSTTEALSS